LKVVPQASNCKEIEVGGRVYRRGRNGLFDMPDSAAKYTIANEGGQLPSLSGTTRSEFGYRCINPFCGFGSFFSTCSRCNGVAMRESELSAH
jgi:hypothetical protein